MSLQADFDVRWCKGPVAERLFKPLIANIESMGGEVLGGQRVSQVQTQDKAARTRYSCSKRSLQVEINDGIGCHCHALEVWQAPLLLLNSATFC